MNRLLLLCPLFLLACATSRPPEDYRQAAPVYRPAPRPPALTPGYNPNTYEPPPYAPAGAGASHGGLASPESRGVPRSPNKRVLPATKEPGLWAADGAPRASSGPAPFFSVPLPYPAPEAGLGARLLMDRCIQSMTDAAGQVGKRARIEAFPGPARACLASVFIFVCGHDESLRLIEAAHEGAPVTEDETKAAGQLQAHGRALQAKNCPGAGVTPQQQGVFDEIVKRWMSNELDRKTSRSTH